MNVKPQAEILFDPDSVTSPQMDALNALAEMKLLLYEYNLLHQKLTAIQNNYDDLQTQRKELCERFELLSNRQPNTAFTKSFLKLDELWKKR